MLLKCLSVPVAAGQSVFRQAERRDNRAVRTADRRASAQQLGRNVKAGGSQLCPPTPTPTLHPFSALQQRNMHRPVMRVFRAIDRKTD